MNNVTLIGRLTKNPDIRTYGENGDKKMARFPVACDRRGKKEEGKQTADFIPCVCYGGLAEFADRYLRQGTKIALRGRIQTGSFTNKEGQKVYTTDVIAEEIEFAESKRSGDSAQPSVNNTSQQPSATDTSFMDVPDSVEEELPWS